MNHSDTLSLSSISSMLTEIYPDIKMIPHFEDENRRNYDALFIAFGHIIAKGIYRKIYFT